MTAAVLARTTPWTMVERAQAGDREAFAELYRHYRPMIAGWIYKHTHNRDLTNDLTGDVFVRALNRIDTVEWQGKDLGAWLHTIARNRLADHYKSARVRLVHLSVETLGELGDSIFPAPWDSAEATALGRLAGGDVMEAVKALRPDQRQVIVLRYFNGLELAETAEVMGRTVGAVKMLQHRALRALACDESLAGVA